jgi:hypothetical protein
MNAVDPTRWRSATGSPNLIRGGYLRPRARRASWARGAAVLGEFARSEAAAAGLETADRAGQVQLGGCGQAGSGIERNQALSLAAVPVVAALPSQREGQAPENARIPADRRLMADLTNGAASDALLGAIGRRIARRAPAPPFGSAGDPRGVAHGGPGADEKSASTSPDGARSAAQPACLRIGALQNRLSLMGSGARDTRETARILGVSADFREIEDAGRVGVHGPLALPGGERERAGYAGGHAGVNRS